ncbi:MAG: PCRF domain-containing protein [Thermodesulfobacteriota bacterium]
MRTNKPLRSNKTQGVIIVGGFLLVALLGAWWFWPQTARVRIPEPPPPPVEPPPPEPAQSDTPTLPRPRPVIRYREDHQAVRELMRRRKEELGLDESVDMIVKSDETLKIGDTTIPMKEILNKIRIKKGGVVEEDLTPGAAALNRQRMMDRLHEKLAESEKRFWALEETLADPTATREAEELEEKVAEHARLGEIVTDYQAYKDTLREIEVRKQMLETDDPEQAVRRQLETLNERAASLETDLRKGVQAAGLAPNLEPGDTEGLVKALTQAENRYWELETALKEAETADSPEAVTQMIQERARLRDLVAVFQEYKQVREEIEEMQALLDKDSTEMAQAIQDELNTLRMARNDLEDALISRLLPAEGIEIYGVYVVQPGDNIWNIHFEFLKEYFRNRGVRLSPVSDEKTAKGVSSGVGKILKFSEKMVHIFNIRERELESDLDMINPLSKIVVFNMGQAFDLLNQIDYENITEIRFDGENLWVPAG